MCYFFLSQRVIACRPPYRYIPACALPSYSKFTICTSSQGTPTCMNLACLCLIITICTIRDICGRWPLALQKHMVLVQTQYPRMDLHFPSSLHSLNILSFAYPVLQIVQAEGGRLCHHTCCISHSRSHFLPFIETAIRGLSHKDPPDREQVWVGVNRQ
ncbi:hypothetical protein FB567DRAFT_517490 [Paraphoma chrysanthemicola]|uniref:Uncharacterized protein n=1 Tax=Paraphoma chrysanthemicola TaxID=798071 RepID=A0A8K0RE30_9PLEO|nr:hypothetical protein FB567DRAFT_517490 [Paraphoma chrysanthemicola]